LPSNTGNRGRNYRDHREVIEGMIWCLRTGAPWRDIPREQFGPWSTIYGRYREWAKTGFWREIFRRINALREQADKLDWTAHFIDGTNVPAHQKATGGSPFSEALGTSRGGLGTKVHVRIDREGHLLNIEVTEGQTQELNAVEPLLNNGAVPLPWGRPKLRPDAIVADKGYNAGWFRDGLHRKHVAAVIPKYDNQTKKGPFQEDLYEERNLIERRIGQFKEYRRVAFRFEKLAAHYETKWIIVEVIESLGDFDVSELL
jgi:transposase